MPAAGEKILRISIHKMAQKRFGIIKDNINGNSEMISKACVLKCITVSFTAQ